MQKLVSIIMPCFNSEKFISEAVNSVQKQTFKNWELIIIDDFSNDYSTEIINKFTIEDKRIKLYKLHENSGAGVARNFGLSKANGQFIAFLDADDLWKSEKLQTQLAFMHENNLPFTFSFYETMNENGDLSGKIITAPTHLKYIHLFFCNFVGNLTGIYSTEYFGKIPINFSKKRQDWMLWLTILKQIKVAQPVLESLAYYRIRESSLSSSKMNLLKHNYKVYRYFHQLNLLFASLCMVGFLFTQIFIKRFFVKNA